MDPTGSDTLRVPRTTRPATRMSIFAIDFSLQLEPWIVEVNSRHGYTPCMPYGATLLLCTTEDAFSRNLKNILSYALGLSSVCLSAPLFLSHYRLDFQIWWKRGKITTTIHREMEKKRYDDMKRQDNKMDCPGTGLGREQRNTKPSNKRKERNKT